MLSYRACNNTPRGCSGPDAVRLLGLLTPWGLANLIVDLEGVAEDSDHAETIRGATRFAETARDLLVANVGEVQAAELISDATF